MPNPRAFRTAIPLLLLSYILVSSQAEESRADSLLAAVEQLRDAHGIMDAAVTESTVEVIGALQGVGTIVLVGDVPKILTNSHVVLGKSTVGLGIPVHDEAGERTSRPVVSVRAEVEFDSPIADIAILSLPKDVDRALLEQMKARGAKTARFCKPGLLACREGVRIPEAPSSFNGKFPKISTMLDGRSRAIRTLMPYLPARIADQYISGSFENVIRIPVFGLPGMSGGGLYVNNQFTGMLTKIDLGAAGQAYAIPVSQIADVISPFYFKTSDKLHLPKSRWIRDGRTYRLEVEADGLRLSGAFGGRIQNIGGDTGNGGGDTGNGGGDTGNGGGDTGNGGKRPKGYEPESAIWNLKVRDWFDSRETRMVNPFKANFSAQQLTVNERPVDYLVSGKKGSLRILSPTTARFLAMNREKENKFEVVYQTPSSRERLMSARKNAPGVLKYARAYKRLGPNRFALMQLEDGVPADPTRSGGQPMCSSFESGNPLSPAVSKEILDFMRDFPDRAVFKRQGDPKDVLNVLIKMPDNTGASMNVKIAQDLREVEYGSPASLAKETLRLADSSTQSASIYLPSKGQLPRMALIYDEADLGKLERAFLEDADYLFEFVYCEIGKECNR